MKYLADKQNITKIEMEYLLTETSWLGNVHLSLRRYCLKNDINNVNNLQKCPICNNIVGWDKRRKRFNNFCSTECAYSKKGKKITLAKFE